MKKIKVISIFGTRPEATKMSPLIKVLDKNENIQSIVCITAQHREMLDQVLEIFEIKPDYDLDIMKAKQTLVDITVNSITGLDEVIKKEKPDLILVHGDTSTTLSGALTAFYNGVKVGHVEAGLRTYDKTQPFPEEMNRVLTGHIADLHFAPTDNSKNNLIKENITENIFVTGNTSIDVLKDSIKENYIFNVDELNKIDYNNKKIITMTAHRRENIGKPLENICLAVQKIVNDNEDVEVVYAVHPNPAVRETANKYLSNNPRIHLIEPLDFVDMHNLMNRSYLVLTDSGGLQEEVPSLNKPVLVLRNVTERPEGEIAGTLKLVGDSVDKIYNTTTELLNDKILYEKMANTPNPFGDGMASERIVNSILYYFGLADKPEEYLQ